MKRVTARQRLTDRRPSSHHSSTCATIGSNREAFFVRCEIRFNSVGEAGRTVFRYSASKEFTKENAAFKLRINLCANAIRDPPITVQFDSAFNQSKHSSKCI
jgi:hypothetical protein